MTKDAIDFEAPDEAALRAAADQARAAVALAPRDEAAARALYDAVRLYRDHFKRPVLEDVAKPSDLAKARRLIGEDDLEAAEVLLRKHLSTTPNDPPAMHMMAEIAAYCGLRADADRILGHSIHIHAGDPGALAHLGATLNRIAVHEDIPEYIFKAAQVFDRALALDPAHEAALTFKAEMMMQTRGLDQAEAAYRKLIALTPLVATHWLNYGYLLKTLGNAGDAVAAMRTALALEPERGSWWWTLADLKNARLFEFEIAEMEQVLESEAISDNEKVPLHFALAKALDSAGEFEGAIGHVEIGSKLRASSNIARSKSQVGDLDFIRNTFTRDFFASRDGWGDPRPGPIFIVGMHRAGSTLVEQILSSHTQIEGSEELFIITKFSNEISAEHENQTYSEAVRGLTKSDFETFGRRYFEISSRSRRTSRPFLTDKYPGNWKFVGLIHCMLPNAKIIDVRRNPMDCCFANYFRYYGTSVDHSYSQSGMAQYYSDYVAAMRHFDAVLPGRVHRIIHDDLVDDLEGEIRRLLDYIGVPFEQNCLRYFETERAVHTPSSEQVRQPINRSGFGKWRNYDPWLADMKRGLGEMLEDWR